MKLKNFLNSADYFIVTKHFNKECNYFAVTKNKNSIGDYFIATKFNNVVETEEMYADEVYELINNEDIVQIKENEDKLTVYVHDYSNYYTIQKMFF